MAMNALRNRENMTPWKTFQIFWSPDEFQLQTLLTDASRTVEGDGTEGNASARSRVRLNSFVPSSIGLCPRHSRMVQPIQSAYARRTPINAPL